MEHKHLIAKGHQTRAYGKEDIAFLEQWMKDLVDLIDMKILIEPKMVYCDTEGNEGVTGIVCIDTSHCSWHGWGGISPFFKFDLYSCKDFSIEKVLDHMKKLDVNLVEYTMIERDSYSNKKFYN